MFSVNDELKLKRKEGADEEKIKPLTAVRLCCEAGVLCS